MIYKVNLDSSDFYSSLTEPNHSHRIYAIDWSFLPEHKRFKMTFSMVSKKRTLNGFNAGANIIRVRCNLGGMFQQNKNGSNNGNNDFIGCIVIKRASDDTNDNRIKTLPHHNPPTFLPSRPTGNFITVEIVNNNETLNLGLSGSYCMTLFFEEI